MSQRWRGWRWSWCWWRGGAGWGWGWCRMRCVPLCVMTGVGFCLGLLCSLLLQLPAAHHLPASGDPAASSAHHHHHHDPSFRSRRSFSAGAVVEGPKWAGSNVPAHRVMEASHGIPPSEGKAFQSVPNPPSGSNPFVSGHTANQLTARPTAHAAVEAEERASGVKRQGSADNGDQGYANTGPPPSPFHQPVRSFTLRLKNTGHKFVVDSAVKRTVEGEAEGERGGLRQEPHPPHTDSRGDNSSEPFTNQTLRDVVSGALWSRRLEDACPAGFQPEDTASWRRKAARMAVVRVGEGCGRMQNRLVTFSDGSQACARYRFNTDQIQGEVFSYYLAQLLQLTRLPPALLLPVDPLSAQWRGVHLELSAAQWADGRPVVLNRWVDRLTPAFIPPELRHDDRQLHPTRQILGGKSRRELCDLLQWSDLIVFDYLTANLDRLVNNMFNQQWNTEMMSNPAHNLERTAGGSLVFLDNESGLFHGYRLLEKYHGYHEALLSSLCVFRESTARAVKNLHGAGDLGQQLQQAFMAGEVHHGLLPALPDKNLNVLKDRLARVHEQIVKCEALYRRR